MGKIANCDIYVVRQASDGPDGMCSIAKSKPCDNCIRAMQKFRIRRVHYSLSDGSVITEKVSEMSLSNYVTWGNRKIARKRALGEM